MRIGRVYKIVVGESNDVYIGSTFNELRHRFANHKNDYKKYLNDKHHKISVYDLFDRYGIDNCKMILIKEYECCDDKHLKAYEQLWINKLRPINKNNPFSIKYLSDKQYNKQYYEANKEKIKEYKKQYREKNKDKIKEYDKQYRDVNKEKIKEKKKEWRESNKQKIKEYREKNSDKLKEYQSQRVNCPECNKEMNKSSLRTHIKNIHK
jgi:hypothetical protein